MAGTMVDYVSLATQREERRALQRSWVRGVMWGVLGAAGLYFLGGVTFYRTETRMDVVTGSVLERTVLPLGVVCEERLDVSPLEKRLKEAGVTWKAEWRFVHETGRSALSTWRGCGSLPAVGSMRMVMAEFAEAASDKELRKFVRVMESGTEKERREAVDRVVDRMLVAKS